MNKKILEYTLVAVQFSTLGYLVLGSSWRTMPAWALIIVAISASLAFWAILSMQLNNLKVTPSPGENARLITSGPYRIIRHPMYSSILLLAIPLVIHEFSLLRLFLAILLIIDLLIKLNYEERLLLTKFSQYKGYRSVTYRILPFIY
ncbi:MAG: isoprenylcysteine carboxylmethyltransferase family protein [Bacteroidetes bacterium]|nr:isoprenylcysteine carboxylmethyltransferase family protein [Bacteroidota bacterium]